MELLNSINDILSNYVLVITLLVAAVVFTIASRGVQFTMFGDMWRLLAQSGKRSHDVSGKSDSHHNISSFQAFMVSVASHVGTGNLAGVATAIALGGPGSVFWMWVIALLGAANSFVESTLAQLFKEKGSKSYVGGPAYYILKGTGKRWWAVTFAVLITVTFGLAFNSVQSNTVADAFNVSFGIDRTVTGVVLTVLALVIIWGGIQGIARFSQWVVPVMAIAYVALAVVIISMNYEVLPSVFSSIFENAFGLGQAGAGAVGVAISMGIKRGLFSNEAGEGSAPNVAATASVSHPAKQGIIQMLGVFVDTLIICTCTALIILSSGVYTVGAHDGIALTQHAIEAETGNAGFGAIFVSVAIFFFAFTSIVGNYYYGETNLRFIYPSEKLIVVYRLVVGAMVFAGAVSTLDFVWGFADITMALMTLCNLAALAVLGRWAIVCLHDYRYQRTRGYDPVYKSSTIPQIAHLTKCWD